MRQCNQSRHLYCCNRAWHQLPSIQCKWHRHPHHCRTGESGLLDMSPMCTQLYTMAAPARVHIRSELQHMYYMKEAYAPNHRTAAIPLRINPHIADDEHIYASCMCIAMFVSYQLVTTLKRDVVAPYKHILLMLLYSVHKNDGSARHRRAPDRHHGLLLRHLLLARTLQHVATIRTMSVRHLPRREDARCYHRHAEHHGKFHERHGCERLMMCLCGCERK